MTDLTPVAALSPVVQLETTSLALGGTGNPMNRQAQALLNRDAFRAAEIAANAAAAAAAASDVVVLRQDLADDVDPAKGSGQVGFIQAGAGAAGRTSLSKLRDEKSLEDFGADKTGVVDSGAEIRSAVASYPVTGGELIVKSGEYLVDAAAGSCVTIVNPVSLSGDGGVYTAINPGNALTTDNTLTISPTVSADSTLLTVGGIALHNPSTGARVGNHGIFCDTSAAGQNLARFTLRDTIVGQGDNAAGSGFLHLNNPANNVNGGLYTSLFQNNVIKGGLRLEESGDSISIVHNTLTGSRIGVYASLVAGASLLEIQSNNITTEDGAIGIDSGSRFRILGNNIEHFTAGAAANNGSAVVNISGLSGTMYGGVIKENLISAFGATDATHLLKLSNCQGTLVEDNVILSGAAGVTTGIELDATCVDVRIGANAYGGLTTNVVDNGIGTMGVIKTLALQNSWVAFGAGTASLQYMKSSDGMVHLWGTIKDGTVAAGTLLATLPAKFSPAEIHRAGAFTSDGATGSSAEITIETNGEIRVNFANATRLSINVSFPAANLANATGGA